MSAKELPGFAPKKAAKKVASKAAKKVAKKAGKKGAKSAGQHQRRTYEHMHRLHILSRRLDRETLEQIETLSQYAESAYRANGGKTAADLLRAGEHLAFGALAPEEGANALEGELHEAVRDEYEHLRDRAQATWEQADTKPARALNAIYKSALSGSKAAWKSKGYHRALELARAADALAHAEPGSLPLPAPSSKAPKKLADRSRS